jgi:hypothetical protein
VGDKSENRTSPVLGRHFSGNGVYQDLPKIFGLEQFQLAPWASRRRKDLVKRLDRLHPMIEQLASAIEPEAKKHPDVLRLMAYPAVQPTTAIKSGSTGVV